MNKVKLATVWLDGCSGCHMSLLDIDERLIALTDRVDVLYSPLVDAKDFPPIPTVDEGITTKVEVEALRQGINQVVFAAA